MLKLPPLLLKKGSAIAGFSALIRACRFAEQLDSRVLFRNFFGSSNMHTFFFKALFLIAFLLGCTPVQFESLEGVGVTCDPQGENQCPEGYFCEDRLDPPECRQIRHAPSEM